MDYQHQLNRKPTRYDDYRSKSRARAYEPSMYSESPSRSEDSSPAFDDAPEHPPSRPPKIRHDGSYAMQHAMALAGPMPLSLVTTQPPNGYGMPHMNSSGYQTPQSAVSSYSSYGPAYHPGQQPWGSAPPPPPPPPPGMPSGPPVPYVQTAPTSPASSSYFSSPYGHPGQSHPPPPPQGGYNPSYFPGSYGSFSPVSTPPHGPQGALPGGLAYAPSLTYPGGMPRDAQSLPDLSRLSLSHNSHTSHASAPYGHPSYGIPDFHSQMAVSSQAQMQSPRMRTRHDAKCAGCGADPIRGEYRWHCQSCANEDICQNCKEAGVKRSHPLEPLTPWTEKHEGYHCDGCGKDNIYGTRRRCQKHKNEDWCDTCYRGGRCCSGPFTEIKQSSVGVYLEKHGGLPMPNEWLHYLIGPPVATYHMGYEDHEEGWLALEGRREFYRKPFREMALSGWEKPAYGYKPQDERRTMSDDKYSWTFKSNPKDGDKKRKLWEYSLHMDRYGYVTWEELAMHKSEQTIPGGAPQFRHGPEVDSLVFTAPDGRRQFRWLTNKPISTISGERWDSQLYALFERVDGVHAYGGPGLEQERIVADMAWWDGHHDAPETAINIRDRNIDHSLVLATLAILLSHQWRVLRAEFDRFPDEVKRTERQARLTYLGRQTYWKKGDAETKVAANGGGVGPRAAMKAAAKNIGITTASIELAANMLELANKLT